MKIHYGSTINITNEKAHQITATDSEKDVKMTLIEEASNSSKWKILAKNSDGTTISEKNRVEVKYGDLVGFQNIENNNWLSARGKESAISVPVCREWEVFKIDIGGGNGKPIPEKGSMQIISEPFQRNEPSTPFLSWQYATGGELVNCIDNGHNHGTHWGLTTNL